MNLTVVPPFRISERVIKLGSHNVEQAINNLENGTVVLPANKKLDDLLVMASPLEGIGEGKQFNRSLTDGRSLIDTLDIDNPCIIHDGAIQRECLDIQVKGTGGADDAEFGVKKKKRSEIPILIDNPAGKHKKKLRFILEPSNTTTLFGFSGTISGIHDSERSDNLAQKGLRTRKAIFNGKIKKGLFSTQEGVKKLEELGLKDDISIEVWALRCRYRLKDLARFIGIITSRKKGRVLEYMETNDVIDEVLQDEDGVYFLDIDPKNLNLNSEEKNEVERNMADLANELAKRTSLDEDDRFRNLGKKYLYKTTFTKHELQSFFDEYLNIFLEVLGEQTAILHYNNAIIDPDNINSQNISMLAEFFDHDVTFVKENANQLEKLNQLLSIWDYVTVFIRNLFLLEALPKGLSEVNIRKQFIESFFIKLLEKDKDQYHQFRNYVGETFQEIESKRQEDTSQLGNLVKQLRSNISFYQNAIKIYEGKLKEKNVPNPDELKEQILKSRKLIESDERKVQMFDTTYDYVGAKRDPSKSYVEKVQKYTAAKNVEFCKTVMEVLELDVEPVAA